MTLRHWNAEIQRGGEGGGKEGRKANDYPSFVF